MAKDSTKKFKSTTKKRIPVEPALYYIDDHERRASQSDLASLSSIQEQTAEIQQQSLESTRRMLQYCVEADKAGTRTLGMLSEQGEQLNRIESQMDTIDANLKETRKNLATMERNFWLDFLRNLPSMCCGCCYRKASTPEVDETSADGSDGTSLTWVKSKATNLSQVFTLQPGDLQQTGTKSVTSNDGKDSAYGGSRATTPASIMAEPEDDLSSNLSAVGNLLGGLRNMALDMGTEITRQNNQLDTLNEKATRNDIALAKAKTSISRLL